MSEQEKAPLRKGFKDHMVLAWRFVTRPSTRFSFGGLLVVGAIFGVLFWGGFNWAMELTNHFVP